MKPSDMEQLTRVRMRRYAVDEVRTSAGLHPASLWLQIASLLIQHSAYF